MSFACLSVWHYTHRRVLESGKIKKKAENIDETKSSRNNTDREEHQMQPSLSLPSAKRISDKRKVSEIEENNEKEVENKQKASEGKKRKSRVRKWR